MMIITTAVCEGLHVCYTHTHAHTHTHKGSRSSEVGIGTATILWAGRPGVQFSLLLDAQTGRGAHPASNSMSKGVISHG